MYAKLKRDYPLSAKAGEILEVMEENENGSLILRLPNREPGDTNVMMVFQGDYDFCGPPSYELDSHIPITVTEIPK